ncbi:helix-turn-helix transcriptional regulator [Sporosarcina trichiuri]|uniref:helix-turn-helix transcriptional regulator n=1 Tax=Sporosarcina trichiuri TaxID=3056445 RepID=UPI0025B53CCA|nr:helix-turn-helix domain-containing protein [Sporosarcina sp. 0.2-SM1T-5]WJY27370.1 helix-turn-helix domain-containing protein [Sporosarcina sp. 0.2-SM1T-5]
MNQEQIIEQISRRTLLIRTEAGYSQETMAAVLGMSKKTLVQIEKERTLASWTTVVAMIALFSDSEIIQLLLGDAPLEVVRTVAHNGLDRPKGKTLGGKVWWRGIEQEGQYRIQQNLISQHYRILDADDYVWFSTFDEEEALERFRELLKNQGA